MLQACGNNPTGCDLTEDDWESLAILMKKRRLVAFLDVAYQGFVSGDVQRDVYGVRCFARHDIPLIVAATYGKAFGLYGERVGHLCMTTPNEITTNRLENQMKFLARAETGAQPRFGALIVSTILEDETLRRVWEWDLGVISQKLTARRKMLRAELERRSKGNWSYVEEQKGMFL